MATAGFALFATLALTITVHAQTTPAVDDLNFEPKAESLSEAPANVMVVQATHFPEKIAKIKHQHEDDKLTRTVGRNVTFRDLMAEAYDCTPGQVVLPADAPTGGFDFLVTVTPKTRKHLREAIEEQLGYFATADVQDTEVMVLQVKDTALPGLQTSTNTDDNTFYLDGRLYFRDQPVKVITKGLEEGLALPVIDHTGLTNHYDFSVAWTENSTRALREGTFHIDGVQRVLNGWGLELIPARTNMEMFIVKKMR